MKDFLTLAGACLVIALSLALKIFCWLLGVWAAVKILEHFSFL